MTDGAAGRSMLRASHRRLTMYIIDLFLEYLHENMGIRYM